MFQALRPTIVRNHPPIQSIFLNESNFRYEGLVSWESVSMETMLREEKKKRRVLTIVKVFAALSAAVLQRAEPCSNMVCPPAAEQAVYVVELQTNLCEV